MIFVFLIKSQMKKKKLSLLFRKEKTMQIHQELSVRTILKRAILFGQRSKKTLLIYFL